jgi:hypothetical protein
MPLDIFRQGLSIASQYGEIPFLGGGEPTLHPLFYQMLCEALAEGMSQGAGDCVGVITNGSITPIALTIASMRRGGVIWAELSRDIYHDPIDDVVVQAFGDATRNTTRNYAPMPHGRGRKLSPNVERNASNCPCSTLLCKPNGDICQCGCDDSPIVGSVFDGINTPSTLMCCREPEFVDECANNPEWEHLLV